MDKELMAKINEALKANGRRELSMDDLDKVVGGESTGNITHWQMGQLLLKEN